MGDCQIGTNSKEKMQEWQVSRINKIFDTKSLSLLLLKTGISGLFKIEFQDFDFFLGAGFTSRFSVPYYLTFSK
jgi:hypothetical protein